LIEFTEAQNEWVVGNVAGNAKRNTMLQMKIAENMKFDAQE